MDNEPVIIEQFYNASASKIWQALTNKDQMRQWYFDVSDFKPEVGFEFHFEAGPNDQKFLHLCKITEVVDEKKLSYTWRFSAFEGDSLLTFELFPANGNTTLKLSHTGLNTFPPKPEFARQNFVDGWNHILGISLKNFVEGQV